MSWPGSGQPVQAHICCHGVWYRALLPVSQQITGPCSNRVLRSALSRPVWLPPAPGTRSSGNSTSIFICLLGLFTVPLYTWAFLCPKPEERGLAAPYPEERGFPGPGTRTKGLAGLKHRRNVAGWADSQKERGFLGQNGAGKQPAGQQIRQGDSCCAEAEKEGGSPGRNPDGRGLAQLKARKKWTCSTETVKKRGWKGQTPEGMRIAGPKAGRKGPCWAGMNREGFCCS